jgi:hypothetical protein
MAAVSEAMAPVRDMGQAGILEPEGFQVIAPALALLALAALAGVAGMGITVP